MSERRYKNPQVNLRLPEELKEKVSRLAEKHKRSANAEMVAAIEFWVEEHQIIDGNRQTVDLLNQSQAIRDHSPIRNIVNEFLEKIKPFMEQEIDKVEKRKKDST